MPKPAKAVAKRPTVSVKPKSAKPAEPVDFADVIRKLSGQGRVDKSPMDVAERREQARRAARAAARAAK
ncbi:MAG TPA: hypothetical protein VGS22_20590 [Thermoanaerobaculia bacterium]|jgi:hypothetical protein|nr:hypothetical protein [Thermoanaerobaculia bacterium]